MADEIPVHVLGPVEPGSVLVIDANAVGPDDEFMDKLIQSVTAKVGHDQFVVLVVPFGADAPAPVLFGPAELSAALARALEPAAPAVPVR